MSTMQNTTHTMSNRNDNLEQNKQTVRRFIEEVWNKGNLNSLDQHIAAGHKNHPNSSAPDFGEGPQGVGKLVSMYRMAYPDTKLTVDDQIAEGDQVVTRWTAAGTHKGELMGVPATNKQVKVTGIFIDRVADGKIMESWGEFDALGMMQQIGAIPAPGR